MRNSYEPLTLAIYIYFGILRFSSPIRPNSRRKFPLCVFSRSVTLRVPVTDSFGTLPRPFSPRITERDDVPLELLSEENNNGAFTLGKFLMDEARRKIVEETTR